GFDARPADLLPLLASSTIGRNLSTFGIEAPLIRVAFREVLLDVVLDLGLGLSPARSDQLAVGRETEEALQPDRRIQALQELGDEIEILRIGKDGKRLPLVLAPESRVPHDVQVMELQKID